jgi:hypothetical protein
LKASEIRNWLGIYFLFTTVILGTYIILFGESRLLPIKRKDAMDAFQIIIPVLVAQVTTVFTWFTANSAPSDDDVLAVPGWVVKAPPLLVGLMIFLTIIAMVVSGNDASGAGWVDASTFKSMVTFSVTILNATAVLVVIRFFGRKGGTPKGP